MDTQELIENTKKLSFEIYPLQPIVVDHGKGCRVTDKDGKEYLDFAAGIAVAALGHAHEGLSDVIATQARRMMAMSSSYVTQERYDASELLVKNSCFDQVYFCNSGAEAVEAALKLARKYSYDNKGEDHAEIIAFNGAFHGRTYGAASVTYKRKNQPEFRPYVNPVTIVDFNDLDAVKNAISKKTAAIIVEPIQGEGGLKPAAPAFLKGLRDLCDENGAALIFDEIQCGMGRTGKLFAYEHYGVEPDIITLAKGIGGGFPVGAMLAKKHVGKHFTAGTHGTTYGGNPLSCAVVKYMAQTISNPDFLNHVNHIGGYLKAGLQNIARNSNMITDVRGMGLMIGADIAEGKVGELRKKLQLNGMMSTIAGSDTLRLVPPLIVTEAEVDEALEKITKTIGEL